ncbi:MAG: glycosyltransferase [Candidatus Omnitrophica bacterium]|nr:glycosyltransferase [Candidatus Omnitrophota bacterium]MBU4488721.1 glycosyltransferase [Candidatus Omnitrophota bacterium]MCG2705750.1 glycosyltransferase [Candidatus Omnitrophota bacterium]
MKVSIITPVLNGCATIEDTIKSILGQSHKEIEHIVIDGGSKDGTVDIVKSYGSKITKFISEPDKGIYDAMNKGIKLASGDIIGILNADDIYAGTSVVGTMAKAISEKKVDACYSDLVYVDRINTDIIVRHWKSCEYREGLFKKGWMPPHPTFFAKRYVYEKYGHFDLSLPIALDYEILFRFMEKSKIKTHYIPEAMVRMRLGGYSNNSIRNIIKQNIVIMKILRENKIGVSPFFFYSKIAEKIKQFR